jgi:hypothetical protein
VEELAGWCMGPPRFASISSLCRNQHDSVSFFQLLHANPTSPRWVRHRRKKTLETEGLK